MEILGRLYGIGFLVGLFLLSEYNLIGSLLIITPGLLLFAQTLKSKKFDTGRRIYEGKSAVIMGFSLFNLSLSFGLIGLLAYFGIRISLYQFMIPAMILFLVPWILADSVDDRKKKKKMEYWIQTPDFKTKQGKPITYTEAIELIKNFEWEKYMSQRERMKLSCPPTIAFHFGKELFQISGNKNSFDIHIMAPNKNFFHRMLGYGIYDTNAKMSEVTIMLQLFYDRKYLETFKKVI